MTLRIKPLTQALGAEVTGVDIRTPLPKIDREAINRALASGFFGRALE